MIELTAVNAGIDTVVGVKRIFYKIPNVARSVVPVNGLR